MEENICRIIKIDRDALFEFIYENFISQQEHILNLSSSVEVSNHFAIDWESGSFIFAAYKGEDAEGNFISFPKDVDIKKVLNKIPATAYSALSPEKKYIDYSFDELREITKE